jgi:hypothetical protein
MDAGEAQTMAMLLAVVAMIAVAVYFVIPRLSQRSSSNVSDWPKRPANDGTPWTDRAASHLGIASPSEHPPTRAGAPVSPRAADQLNRVMAAPFSAKRIMSRSEYDVFRLVEREVIAAGGGHRVFAQTCLGEILNSPDEGAFFAINAKRTDILVVGQNGMPCFAVEYQGEGHYQSEAAARDAVKKEALRKAGVGYVEILHTHSLADMEDLVRMQLRQWMPAPERQTFRNTPRPNLRPIVGSA